MTHYDEAVERELCETHGHHFAPDDDGIRRCLHCGTADEDSE